MRTLGILLASAFALPAMAESTRELDSHEHGVGTLTMAVEGDQIALVFEAPGADIVGFEHVAKSEEDHALIDAAMADLARPFDLFSFPAGAGCEVVNASVKMLGGGDHDDHDHEAHGDEDHADHGQDESHADHDHEDGHDEAAHDDHDHSAEHEDEVHASESNHTEFRAEYALTCANIGAIDALAFPYFERFENAREIELQVAGPDGAGAYEVTSGNPGLDLGGMF